MRSACSSFGGLSLPPDYFPPDARRAVDRVAPVRDLADLPAVARLVVRFAVLLRVVDFFAAPAFAVPVRVLADLLAVARLVAFFAVVRLAVVFFAAVPARFLVDLVAVARLVLLLAAFPAVVFLADGFFAAPVRDLVDLVDALRVVGRVVADFFAVRFFVVLAAISVGSFSWDDLECLVRVAIRPDGTRAGTHVRNFDSTIAPSLQPDGNQTCRISTSATYSPFRRVGQLEIVSYQPFAEIAWSVTTSRSPAGRVVTHPVSRQHAPAVPVSRGGKASLAHPSRPCPFSPLPHHARTRLLRRSHHDRGNLRRNRFNA